MTPFIRPVTMAHLINRLRDDFKIWWDRISYHPERHYMRGQRDA